jgi:hypothetical protein
MRSDAPYQQALKTAVLKYLAICGGGNNNGKPLKDSFGAVCDFCLTGEEWVKQLDPDGDGKVSKSEFKAPPDLKVSTLDKNGDHYISTDEGHQRSASPPRRSWRSERLISLPHSETLTCLRKFLLFFAVSQSSTR